MHGLQTISRLNAEAVKEIKQATSPEAVKIAENLAANRLDAAIAEYKARQAAKTVN